MQIYLVTLQEADRVSTNSIENLQLLIEYGLMIIYFKDDG